MQMIDVHSGDRRAGVAPDPLHPAKPELQFLIRQFKLQLPPQPPPRITIVAATHAT
jgi:hypothetical protein